MKVFTYYSVVPNMNAFEQARMIEIWKRAWAARGWEPVVLKPGDAKASPLFNQLVDKFRAMPTVNHKDYEMACWLRWIAMANHGGIMVDYDVLPFGFSLDCVQPNSGPYVSILADHNPCPCAVIGTAEQFANTARLLSDYVVKDSDRHGDRPHISDQNAIQAMSSVFRPHIHDLCPEYRSRHWQVAPLVHFCHAATHGHDRVALMRAGMEGVRE